MLIWIPVQCIAVWAITCKLHHVDQKDEDALVAMMKEMEIAFDSDGHVFINQEDVSTKASSKRYFYDGQQCIGISEV